MEVGDDKKTTPINKDLNENDHKKGRGVIKNLKF